MANPAPGFLNHPDHKVEISAPDFAVQVLLDGDVIAQTHRAVRLDEGNYPPRYYLPAQDVAMDRLSATDHTSHCPFKGDARYWTVITAERKVENGAWAYDAPFDECLALKGRIAFYSETIDVVPAG